MADDTEIPAEIQEGIDKAVGDDRKVPKKKGKYERSYKVVGDSKIPVSKVYGKIWASRKDAAVAAMDDRLLLWKESIRYYNNDQMAHRKSIKDQSGNVDGTGKLNNRYSETENIVFANVTSMVPILYSKNPSVTVTALNGSLEPRARSVEKLINVLAEMKDPPGLNLKPKAKRCVVTALLTNAAYAEIGWTSRETSSQQAVDDLEECAKVLQVAKTTKEIMEAEGKIKAIEEKIDVLRPEGPFVRVVSPQQIMGDPEGEEVDHTDANWLMRWDFLPTSYLRARYGEKKSDGSWALIYKPTHVLKAGSDAEMQEDSLENFTLFDVEQDHKKYGYGDEESYDKAQRTKVWYCWDRITQRLFLYNDGDWEWPIWVWDDPLKIQRFFPYFSLSFYVFPDGINSSKGEVCYYLDQQDAINEINDESRRARAWVKRNVLFDKNSGISREDVEAFLTGSDGTARPVDVPEGKTMKDIIFTAVPPSVNYPQLFDKADKYAAIDRISSVDNVMRGQEFKTNTTNDAVASYGNASKVRTDDKTDAIEEWTADVLTGVAQLCLMYMKPEQVVALIGSEFAEGWENMSREEIQNGFTISVAGGSTVKPTSQSKKKEALEVGQVLGQFAATAPGPVIKVLLNIFSQAFDEIVMTKEDWEELEQSIFQQQAASPGGPGGEGGSPNGGEDIEPLVQEAVAKGVPENVARQRIQERIGQQPS